MDPTRNIYKEDVNFAELAAQDVEFAKVLKPNGQLDFSDPASVQQLTKALLKRDFNLSLTLPPDRLCPPVPNRLNYILWVQDLLDTTSDSFSDRFNPAREVIGLDIGTGASCIYPLLGCTQRPKWKFVGTDIDDLSLTYAKRNISDNDLSDRIRLHKSTPNSALIPLSILGISNLSFTMSNPPFYTSQSELLSSAAQKSRPPNSACTGTPTEMVTPGGEVAFVSRMIAESLLLRERVQWYSSMLGKLSSVGAVVETLRSAAVGNYAVTEFVQGSRTRRWAVAWSFADLRPKMSIARGVAGGGIAKHLLPFPAEYVVSASTHKTDLLSRNINAALEALPLQWRWRADISTGVGFAARNVWSRSARRKSVRNLEMVDKDDDKEEEEEGDDDEDDMAFGFKISIEEMNGECLEQGGTKVVIRWLKGADSAIFESFCGMVKRKLEE